MNRQSPIASRSPMLKTLLAFSAIALPIFGACTTPKRPVRVGSDAATLKVKMANLASSDQNRSDWIYELSGCVSPLNGNLEAGDTLTFAAVGLKAALTGCQLKIRSLDTIPGITFAAQSEPGVLYWSRELELTEDFQGALTAVANLQKLYTVTASAMPLFTLVVPVKFAAPEAGTVVTAGIQCSPEILSAGIFERQGDVDGQFTFKAEIKADASYICSKLEVRVDGGAAAAHTGAFGADTGTFVGKPGDTFKTQTLALTAVPKPATTHPASGVEVNTKGEDCNRDGKVYNAATKKCEDI